MFRRALIGLMVVSGLAFGVLGFSAPASAGQYPVSCGFILDPPVVLPGGQVNILGSGFTPGSTVTFFINGTVLGTTVADNDTDGNINATFSLPPQFDTDGEFTITADCPNGEVASNVLIVGTGVPTTLATAVPLPVTGANGTMDLVRIGAALVAGGGIVLLAVRRRAHAEV